MRNAVLAALALLPAAAGLAHGQAALAPATDVNPAPMPAGRRGAVNTPPPPPPSVEEESPPPGGGPLGREWQRMEYLLWWIKSTGLPPLATTNSSRVVASLSASSTVVAVGGNELENGDRSGGRFTIGVALDPGETVGLEGSYFFLGTHTTTVGVASSGSPAIGVPYYDVTTATEQVQTAAFPGFAHGGVAVSASSRMQGAELNGVVNFVAEPMFQLDGVIGFRYLEVDEGIQVAYFSQRFSGEGGRGLSLGAADQFDGHNRFFGGQVGLRAEFRKGPLFVDLAGKVALGDTYEVVRINGVSNKGSVLMRGGTLALPTNSGRFTRDMFAVLPEGTVRVGWLHRDRTRVFVGYNFLYLSELARPGDQIDRNVNPTQLPLGTRGGTLLGAARPQFAFNGSDFWAQGLIVGVEYRY